ncbi:Homoserine/homoserine lactone efflux protein [Palleronia abyssalis]|uniref:Homoserine/homoserine lactone efflux protein n=1 Tax=Palleronia abyssalis TaxID=1501240 RepID=A0A2R8C0D9_9RHOB|nr:Homoserine/homoserine lactone efflux protein [Palleronia abyssalis]
MLSGDLVAMTASLAGGGALVLASATLFTVLKWNGGLYLVYLGVKLFRSAPGTQIGNLEEPARASTMKVFGRSVAVTALNPKSIVFFIAFVPQFVTPAAPLPPPFSILTTTFVGLAGLNAVVYALLGGSMRRRIAKAYVLPLLGSVGGAALVCMGIAAAAAGRST